jgi:hypothetical protein
MPARRIERVEVPRELTPERTSFTFHDETYFVRERYKVGRFLKALNNDPIGSLELVLDEDSYERFLDLEISMTELNEFLESLAKTISGSSLGN